MKKKDYFDGKKVYEVTEEQKSAVITKEEGNACRHRLEKRWFRRLAVLNVLIIVVVLAMFFTGLDDIKDWTKHVSDPFEEEMSPDYVEDKTQYRYNALDDVPFTLTTVGYGVVIFVAIFFVVYYMYAQYRTMSLRITEKNFPEV